METTTKRPGKIVQLPYGRKGIVYNDSEPVNGKMVVCLVDDTPAMKPVMNDNDPQEQMKMLAAVKDVKIIGFVD